MPGDLLNITAQDLLGKSHEELVLVLITLRRQSSALNECIDGSKQEMDTLDAQRNQKETESSQRMLTELRAHIRELEEQKARAGPVISLVDNMVKLGSLYRGPQDAPLSHRIRNLPSKVETVQTNPLANTAAMSRALLQDEEAMQQRKADIQVRNHSSFGD